MLRNLSRRLRNIEAEEAFGLLVGGIIIMAMFLLFGVFIVLMIEKIAYAIVIIGVGILAMGAGVMLLKKGMNWIKKGA